MDRSSYKIFSPGVIAGMTVPNRLVRSATWDPSILMSRQMTEEVLEIYRRCSLGGVGAIISGGFPVYRERFPDEEANPPVFTYPDLRINGLEEMSRVVHEANPECKIIAQLETGYFDSGPSPIISAFSHEVVREMGAREIEQIVGCFADGIRDMRRAGFDGVQLHAAHGGLLSRFLSPYSNRRHDVYGGTPERRAEIVREIIHAARQDVGDYPILIKMNGTDYLDDGIGSNNFTEQAREVVRAGVDAVEISGGMWECLLRPAEELDFRAVPSPEAHTHLHKPEQQSYFLKYAEQLDLDIPVLLVGGNRDVERLEAILQDGKVDFIALCRPLIREPDLPNRWKAGIGKRTTECVSCNSCIFAMIVHPGKPEPGLVECVCKKDKKLHHQAQKWLATWRNNQLGKS